MILEAYHGTDAKNADSILSENFIYKRNKKHWLGNGIYFYLDLSLAKWWTTNPTRKFGVKIKNGVIIDVTIDIDDTYVFDLRKLSDFKTFVYLYYSEFLPYINSGIVEIPHQKYHQIRCSYCDFLQEQYQIKAIIGNFFYKKHRSYSPDKYDEFVEKIDLHYIETQLCLFDKTCIIDKHLHI